MTRTNAKIWYFSGAGILVLAFLAVFYLTFNAQLQELITEPVRLTLSSVHKREEEFNVTLSEEQTEVSESFLCTLPDVQRISFTVAGLEGEERSGIMKASLLDPATGEVLAEKTYSASSLKKDTKRLRLSNASYEEDSAAGGRPLLLRFMLGNPSPGLKIHLTGNIRQGFVLSFNGNEAEKINLINTVTYSDGTSLETPYYVLCAALLLFALVSWWLLIVRKRQLFEVFLPLALILGAVFCVLIPPYSVPDENIHMENAYKYSDVILGVQDTGNPGTIYKRRCDVLQADLMGNTLESSTYYQMANHLFDRPSAEDRELVEVSYADVGKMVPFINYIPCALGISLGRLMGCSSLLTLTIGRYFNLIIFVLLSWIAIRLLPYGKNAAAMLMLLPISLQQGASSSYDSLLNGVLVLFVAVCLNIYERCVGLGRAGSDSRTAFGDGDDGAVIKSPGRENRTRIALLVAAAVLTLYLAQTKGGVYLPLCILLVFAVGAYLRKGTRGQMAGGREAHTKRNGAGDSGTQSAFARRKVILIAAAAVVVLAGAFLFAKMARGFLTPMLQATQINGGEGYSLGWLITHPLEVLFKYWNTFQSKGYDYLNGMMGGYLSWLDIKVNRLYPIAFLFGTVILAHTRQDRFEGRGTWRAVLLGTGILDILLIMFSMLLAWSTMEENVIEGVQGRYFIGFAILLFLGSTTGILDVDRKSAGKTAFAMMIVEVLTVLSVVAVV